MVRLNRFNGSNSGKVHNRLSVEEMEDFFIQHIDNGDLKYYHSGIEQEWNDTGSQIIDNKLSTYWELNRKFNSINSLEKFDEFIKLINSLSSICRRWKLDFEFKLIAIGNKPGGGGPQQTQFIIKQEVPTEIINYFSLYRRIGYNHYRINLYNKINRKRPDFIGGTRSTYTIQCHLQQDKDMNFYFYFDLNKNLEYKEQIIEELRRVIKVPFEFLDRKDYNDSAKWYFKLLI
jgi:hypothetical protein